MTTKREDFPLQTRAATITPATIDPAKRTVEVVWSTGATVRRFSWSRGEYDEQVVLSGGACDLSRLNAQAPVLIDHWASVEATVGVVERAWIENDEGRAVLRFMPEGQDEDSDKMWAKVAAGVVRNISAGYFVRRYDITERDGMVPLYRAVDWQPAELSLVAIPADAGAQTRSAAPVQACTFARTADDRSLRLRLLQLGR
jgi:hypothetical protein